MLPNINYATARVLDAVGIQTVVIDQAVCCGAVKFHLNDQEGGKDQMRANIDAWWPAVQAGEVEAIVSNASGCGVMIKDYGHALRLDAQYADKAARISALARDLAQLLPDLLPELVDKLAGKAQLPPAAMAYHPPCTLQHGQKLKGVVEANLSKLGFTLKTARTEAHLCCGSAGTYSVLQADISQTTAQAQAGRFGRSLYRRQPASGHPLGQHWLHQPPAGRHQHPGAALGGGAGRGAGTIRTCSRSPTGVRARLRRSASLQILAIAKLLLWFAPRNPSRTASPTPSFEIMNTFSTYQCPAKSTKVNSGSCPTVCSSVEAAQFGQIHNGGPFHDGSAQFFQQLFARHHGAAGGNQVVDEQHLVARPHGIGVQLDGGAAVFKFIGSSTVVKGQLALLRIGTKPTPSS